MCGAVMLTMTATEIAWRLFLSCINITKNGIYHDFYACMQWIFIIFASIFSCSHYTHWSNAQTSSISPFMFFFLDDTMSLASLLYKNMGDGLFGGI